MSTAHALTPADLADDGAIDYRPVSTAAIASVVFGALSILVFMAARDSFDYAVMLTPVPLIGLALGIRALVHVRANPDHLTGVRAAQAGIALSTFCLVGGLGLAGYVHATEVPEGYIRTSFAEMKPDEVDLRGDRAIPPEIEALDGQKVFIKGYYRPDSSKYTKNVKNFLLVRDSNQCCFGDLSSVQFYDQMAVVMAEGKTVDYSEGLYRMGGKLHIKPENVGSSSGLPVFILEADYAE